MLLHKTRQGTLRGTNLTVQAILDARGWRGFVSHAEIPDANPPDDGDLTATVSSHEISVAVPARWMGVLGKTIYIREAWVKVREVGSDDQVRTSTIT